MAVTPGFVLLTRPEGRGTALAGRLCEAGLHVRHAPALVLSPLPLAPGAFEQARQAQLLVFVSGMAVRSYFSAMDAMPWPAGKFAAAVGSETARALRDSGRVPDHAIIYSRDRESTHDSESLWPLLASRLPDIRRAVIVRGETGREWLGDQLAAAGVAVERLSAYRREPAAWTDADRSWLEEALASGAPCVTLLTSSEGVDAVCCNIERFSLLPRWGSTRFVAIHRRIAQRLQSVLAASGNDQPPMVQLCQPVEDSIYKALLLMASSR